jgi:hypothetical protein
MENIEDLLSKAKGIIQRDYNQKIRPEILKNMYDAGKDDGFKINHDPKNEGFKSTHIDLITRDRLITSDELKEKGIEIRISETIDQNSNIIPYKIDLKFQSLFLKDENPFEEVKYNEIIKSYVESRPLATVRFKFKSTLSHLDAIKSDSDSLIQEYIAGVVEGRLEVIRTGKKLDNERLKQTIDLMDKYNVMSSQRFKTYINTIVEEASAGNTKSLAVLGEIQKYLK